MTTPSTWVAVQAIVQALQVISTGAGYHTNAGSVVTAEPAQVSAQAAIALGVAYVGSDKAAGGFARTHRLARFVVEAKAATTTDVAWATLHNLIADIERAMADQKTNQARFPTGIQYPQFVKSEVIPPGQSVGWVGVRLLYESHIPIG